MKDEEKPGEWENTYRRLRWLRLLRAFIPDWIRVPFLRFATVWKARRLESESHAKAEQYVLERAEREPVSFVEGFQEIVDSLAAKFLDLQNALAKAESSWFVARALKQRVPLPSTEDWEGEVRIHEGSFIDDRRLKTEPLRDFKDAVIKAERETWKHRREWMAFIFAVLFGVVTAVSVFYNILSTQRRLNDIQGKLNGAFAFVIGNRCAWKDRRGRTYG